VAALCLAATAPAGAMQLQANVVAEALAVAGLAETGAAHDGKGLGSSGPCAAKTPDSTYVVAMLIGGRRDRMNLTVAYLDRLIAACHLDEVHIWDNAIKHEDSEWLATLADQDGYTVFLPGGHNRWLQAYRYYTAKGTNESLSAVGTQVLSRFTPKWEGANIDNTVLIKLDDDIVFVDTEAFPGFVQYVRSTPHFLVHANIINNGVAAYYQAQKDPELLERLPELADYPSEHGRIADFWPPFAGNGGPLVMKGALAKEFHRYFIEHRSKFGGLGPKGEQCILYTAPHVLAGQGRFSINFFGTRWSKWDMVADLVGVVDQPFYDEFALTVQATEKQGISECIYSPFVVAHLSFSYQLRQGDIDRETLPWYRDLAEQQIAEWAAASTSTTAAPADGLSQLLPTAAS